MRNFQKLIHSPSSLFAFEAAARHMSFSLAARELNVSQPAVSLAVKKLENALGVRLFERRHRRIEFTRQGERFYADVSFGLMHIQRSAESIALQEKGSHVTLSCSTAFAHYWMVPRLARFKAAYPDIDIRVQTTDRDIDLDRENISLSIRRGDGPWAGYESRLLTPERIYPVCSPKYVAEHGSPGSIAELARHSLIHLEEPFRLRPGWVDWFAQNGFAFADQGGGLRLNDYALVIEAAMAGEGIAFGWHHIVAQLVSKGLLVKALDAQYRGVSGFHVIWASRVELSPQASQFRQWLLDEAGQDTIPPLA
ncbi:MAG: LysR substrate-binding domain-containing protein [Rhizobiaceae bacterium]